MFMFFPIALGNNSIVNFHPQRSSCMDGYLRGKEGLKWHRIQAKLAAVQIWISFAFNWGVYVILPKILKWGTKLKILRISKIVLPVVPVILPEESSHLSDSYHEKKNHVTFQWQFYIVHICVVCHLIGKVFWQEYFTQTQLSSLETLWWSSSAFISIIIIVIMMIIISIHLHHYYCHHDDAWEGQW